MAEPLIYCEGCGSHQPLAVDPMRQDTQFPHQGIWGDLMCATCHLVINNIRVEQEGIYVFQRIRDLDG